MVLTNNVDLPCEEDITVDELNLSQACLMSAAPYIGKCCENVNSEYVLCRQELNDPRACVEVGKQVTACTRSLLKLIKQSCLSEFKQYQNCIDKSSGDFSYTHCRKTQEAFDTCMDKELDLKRPHFGYFCRGRIHETARPAPKSGPCPCHSQFKDETDSLPEEYRRCAPPARFTSRFYWMNE